MEDRVGRDTFCEKKAQNPLTKCQPRHFYTGGNCRLKTILTEQNVCQKFALTFNGQPMGSVPECFCLSQTPIFLLYFGKSVKRKKGKVSFQENTTN